MTLSHWFTRKPRCVECRTTEHLHQVEHGMHPSYVCSHCAIKTGYVAFLPQLAAQLQAEMQEIHEGNYHARPEDGHPSHHCAEEGRPATRA